MLKFKLAYQNNWIVSSNVVISEARMEKDKLKAIKGKKTYFKTKTLDLIKILQLLHNKLGLLLIT